MKLRTKRRRRSHMLNLTSLIDVLLLLLIFFVVTSTFVETPAIEFKLPKVSEAGTVKMSPVVVIIDATGQIYFDGRKVTLTQLQNRLMAVRRARPGATLVVKVHRDTRYEQVVRVMTLASSCGFDKIQSPVVTGRITPSN